MLTGCQEQLKIVERVCVFAIKWISWVYSLFLKWAAAMFRLGLQSRQTAYGPIADVRVLQVKQVQQVNANGQFVLFSIPAILTIVVVVGRFELPLIDGAQAKFKSD